MRHSTRLLQVVLVEFDTGPRSREVIVQLMGEPS